jgi:hypothetical protein
MEKNYIDIKNYMNDSYRKEQVIFFKQTMVRIKKHNVFVLM